MIKNPFLTRMRPYPVKMLVDIHAYCNARCTMCPYPKYARQLPLGQMPWSMYTRIVDEFGALGREHGFAPLMGYCYMGEPFLAENLESYVQYALEQGVQVYLNTNASEMTPQKIDALLNVGYRGDFFVSFHGITPEVYERISGLDFRRSLEHVLYLLDHYDASSILIRGVDDQWPVGEAERWRDFWAPKGVRLEYLPPISRCGSVKRLSKDKPEREKVRLHGCRENHPLVEMVVLYDGRAVMCCQDMGREVIWGNVAEQGIETVWNSPRRVRFVEQLYNGMPMANTFLCARCEQAMTSIEMVRAVARAGCRHLARAGKHVLSGVE